MIFSVLLLLLRYLKNLNLKKYLLQLAFFVAFVLIMLPLSRKLILPYYWGAEGFAYKIRHIEQNQLQPDIYFVGPSTVMRHIMPSVFDSDIGNRYSSFNLSQDGSYPQHDIHIFKNFIKKNRGQIKYAFFEMNSLDKFGKMRYHTTYSKYHTSLKSLLLGLQYVKFAPIDNKLKKETQKKYLVSFIEKFFNVGMRKDIAKYISNRGHIAKFMIGKKGDGFLPVPNNKKNNAMLGAQLSNTVANKKKAIQNQDTNDYNPALLKLYSDNIAYLKNKGIHAIYILPPKKPLFDSELQILNVFKRLPDEHKIDLSNPNKYPQFYAKESRFDFGHLNVEMAKEYTKYLALDFLELENKLN